METRDRSRPRSRRDSVQRRRLEAQGIAPLRAASGPAGTYSYVRGKVPSPRARVARGSDAFSPLDRGWDSEVSGEILAAGSQLNIDVEPPRAEKLTVLAPEPRRRLGPWILVGISLVCAGAMIALALILR